MFRFLSTAVLLLLVALPGVALAQGTGTLAGRVTDVTTGETLPGANIRIEGTTLGAAANINGEYRIIGVPVGTYTVTGSFAGYQPSTVTDVTINNGYTRDLDFSLSPVTLGTVEVTEYRQPLIQRDAITTGRVTTGAELQNLPIRGVAAVTALQGGVVSTEGTSDLNIRGSREQEVAYYVDGVRVSGSALVGVNQQAIQEQEMLIGTIPARYGDVQSGVISISTKTGRQDFFGSAEVITSTGLDSYGYNLFSLSLGGPIVPGTVGFFLSGELNRTRDANPYGIETYRLSDDAYAALRANPQVITVTRPDGSTHQVNFPYSLISGPGISLDSLQTLMLDAGLLGIGESLGSETLLDAAETFTADRFDTVRGKRDPLGELTVNGNLNFDVGDLNFRLGGGYVSRDREIFSFSSSLYNRDAFNHDERESYRVYGTFRHRLSDRAFYQVQGEFQDYRSVLYPNGFSANVEDVLLYGDASNAYSEVAQRYYVYRGGQFEQQFAVDGGGRPSAVRPGTFSLPGRTNFSTFTRRHEQQYRVSASATAQAGVHQMEFGGEFQQETRRLFSINGIGLAGYVNDADGPRIPIEGFPDGISNYSELPFSEVRSGRALTYYGYNYLGTTEVNDQDPDGYFPDPVTGLRSNTNIAPYQPRYFAGYFQDKIEYRDLVIQLGLRMDVFDNNTLVLRDLWAPTPIVRADALGSRPGGVESDWAVYYNSGSVVGFRDLEGNFYDTEGGATTADEILQVRRGQVQIDPTQSRASVFRDYEPQLNIMPRLGVSFPVTDRALFFASYNVVSQRPTESAFTTFRSYEEITGQNSQVANPGLEPERTTQYELGFRQRLGQTAAISLSGFYRTQDNKISNRTLIGALPTYGSFLNADFTTTQGVEANFDLRRTRNLALTANYTLSFAQGTGSDANATSTVVWRGNYFPQFISPSDFDQRHTLNLLVDYRFGDNEGPLVGDVRLLENFGVNVIGQFGSGQRYTGLLPNTGFGIFDSFTTDADGRVNSGQLPGTSRIDLRLDRSFDLGFQDSKLQAYLLIQNLLDTSNVLAVYRGTGLPDQDGYVNTPGGQVELNSPGRLFNYQAYIGGPINVGGQQSSSAPLFYSLPRQIRLGLLFSF